MQQHNQDNKSSVARGSHEWTRRIAAWGDIVRRIHTMFESQPASGVAAKKTKAFSCAADQNLEFHVRSFRRLFCTTMKCVDLVSGFVSIQHGHHAIRAIDDSETARATHVQPRLRRDPSQQSNHHLPKPWLFTRFVW